MIWTNYFLCFLAFWSLSLTSSAPVNKMSPFLKSMIGTKTIKSGDIPSYSTKPAHVTQTSPVTKRGVDNSDARHYMIQTTDEIMNITLYPNRKLLSRNFIVQQRTDDGGLETMNVSVKNCYYTGSVADHEFSRVAFSMCDGEMKGIIEIDDDMYVMEPADERNNDHSHVAHKMKHKPMKFEDNNVAMMGADMEDEIVGALVEKSGAQKNSKRQTPSTPTIELMVYVDAAVQSDARENGFTVTEYILGIINIMARLYRDPTLQRQIDLTLTRLILEGVNGAASINITRNVSPTLNTFCSYQQSINTPDDSNSLHFDHAILITNVDLCGSDGNGGCSAGVIGYAPVGGMCSQSRSCTINENTGFGTAFTLAHETGHNLGMQHDGTNNVCVNSRRIMASSGNGQAENFLWSSCSASYLQSFLSSGSSACLNDVPEEAEFDVNVTQLVGLEFSADEQCQARYGPTAVFCPFSFATDEICSRLWCQPNGGSCTTRNLPPADGTSCGSTNICVRGQCIDGSSVVTPVNGGWSEFGPYSSCSRTCGGGVRYRERQCNNPTPKFGGSFCPGSARKYDPQLCNTNECPQGSPSFIDQQCTATNDRPFNGVLYRWQEFTGNVIGVTPCQLVCTSAQRNIIAVREPVAEDGTPCDNPDSSNAVCVQGTCTPVGCDDVLESGAQPDSCGVCNGDNSGARLVTNTLTGSGSFGYYTAGVIPVGARNIRIAETTATSSVYLALQSQGRAILNNGFRVRGTSSFTAIGSTFQYIRSSSEESVSTTGPLQQQLTVQALLVGTRSYSLTVEYSVCNSS